MNNRSSRNCRDPGVQSGCVEQDLLDFPSPWSKRKPSSPVIRSSASDGPMTMPVHSIYRPENLPFPVEVGGRCAANQDLAAKHRVSYYASGPRHHSSRLARLISSPDVHHRGSAPDAGSPVGLAVPKPVYGLQPCCTERRCTARQSFSVDHGPHPLSPCMYEEEWAAHFNHLAYLHKKGLEALVQKRSLRLDPETESLHDHEVVHDIGSDGPRWSLPAMRQSPSSFVYDHHPFSASRPPYCQNSPQMYKKFPSYEPSPVAFRGVPSSVYPNLHFPKHSPVPLCPGVFYSQSRTEAYDIDPKAATDDTGQFVASRADFSSSFNSIMPPHHPLAPRIPLFPQYRMSLGASTSPVHKPFSLQQAERPLDFSVDRVNTPETQLEFYRRSGSAEASVNTPAAHQHASRSAHLHNFRDFTKCHGEKRERRDSSESSKQNSKSRRQREESQVGMEADLPEKRQRTEMLHEFSQGLRASPPMPVINKVFTLAPYLMFHEATAGLPLHRDSEGSERRSEAPRTKQETLDPDIGDADLLKPDPQNLIGPVKLLKPEEIKQEKLDPDEMAYQSEMKEPVSHLAHEVKEEQRELESGSEPWHIVFKEDFEDESNPESSAVCKAESAVEDLSDSVSTPSSDGPAPSVEFFNNVSIPLQCLDVSNYQVMVPALVKAPTAQPKSSKEVKSSSKHQLMELHKILCRWIRHCVTQTTCHEHRNWLSQLGLQDSLSPLGKSQRVACLIGPKIREVWLKGDEMQEILGDMVLLLQNHVENCECPFPHVMRAGAVFIPMLVVKELLFPHVQSAFIDQVLQEHRVQLRPTTLSEERQLTQLHRKAFSSKLRRLLSLKHLPEIYPDVLNLLYYHNVLRFLGLKTRKTSSSDESRSPLQEPQASSTRSSIVNSARLEKKYCLNSEKKKGRVKSSCKRTFLDETGSSQEEEAPAQPERWRVVSTLERDEQEAHAEVEIEVTGDEDASWRRPLTSDDLSSDPSDSDRDGQSSGESHGVVLKLKKVFSTDGQSGSSKIPFRSSELYKKKTLTRPSFPPARSKKHRHRWLLRSAAQSAAESPFPDLVGKKIRHLYEEKDKREVWYRGTVLRIHEPSTNPLKTVFEVKYDSEPEWQYYLELLQDYKKGWLKVEE